jgi:hypothetical protein
VSAYGYLWPQPHANPTRQFERVFSDEGRGRSLASTRV